MNPSRRDVVRDEPQPEEAESEEVLIPQINIPPGSDHQRMIYLARVAEMFYITVMTQHYDVYPRFRGEIPSDGLHETLFQLQLVTQALIDGYYYEAAEMLEMANSDSTDLVQIRAVIQRLKDVYPDTARGSLQDIGYWFYTKHCDYLRSVGRDLGDIERGLGIVPPEPEAEVGSGDDEFDGEEPHERETRYRNSELCEVSDPDLWFSLHHWSPSSSD